MPHNIKPRPNKHSPPQSCLQKGKVLQLSKRPVLHLRSRLSGSIWRLQALSSCGAIQIIMLVGTL